MLAKYTIEYALPSRRHAPINEYHTDDPVTAKEFLEEALDRGLKLKAIRHEGVDLSPKESDRLVNDAARMLAAKRICQSLDLSADEEHFRFGLTA